jgi:nitrous oxide reductase accessory protein NosL
MKTCYPAIALMIASSTIGGCTLQARSPEPMPIDRVECAHCRMLISTDAGGGEIVSAGEETRFYDDIGCLAAEWPRPDGHARAYVRVAGGGWSDAQAASYAQSDSARTPMASGFTAFSTSAEARAADRTGRALTFDDVVRSRGAVR